MRAPAAFALLFGLLLGSAPARADVVDSPPWFCLPGYEGVTSHSGSRCEKKAPTNCPSGWEGWMGDVCGVSLCNGDSGCEEGEACVPASVCTETRKIHDRMSGGEGRDVDFQVGICGPGATCDAPRRCEDKSVCVRKGEKPIVFVPQPGKESPGVPRRAGSCGSCAAGEERGAAAATLASGVAIVLAAASRRRRQPKR